MSGLENLDPTPWLVNLDRDIAGTADAVALYRAMREAEDIFLSEAQDLGCTVVRERRGALVVVPSAALANLPPFPDPRLYWAWEEAIRALAQAQAKKPGVGTRSSCAPYWLGPQSNCRYPCPQVAVQKITYRRDVAARGAQLTGHEALALLYAKAGKLTEYAATSERRGQRTRAASQRARADVYALAAEQLATKILHAERVGNRISAQLMTGKALMAFRI